MGSRDIEMIYPNLVCMGMILELEDLKKIQLLLESIRQANHPSQDKNELTE